MSPKHKPHIAGTLILALLLLTACGAQIEPEGDSPSPVSEASDTAPPAEIESPTQESISEPALPALAPERRAVEIVTEDGRVLEGYYYPAAVNPAPVVVLMHWAGGDMDDWQEIAPWLQNRSDELAATGANEAVAINWQGLQGVEPWLDSSWFPTMPEGVSIAVLVFNFGGFGGSPPGSNPQSWADEALAAVHAASELEGISPSQIAAIGASIGADGAVDGCYLFNASGAQGTCVGALSLSPGNYLTTRFSYAEAAQALDEAGWPVWCLNAEGDMSAYETCASASGEHYLNIVYPNVFHGMYLVQPDYLPGSPPLGVDTLVTIQDFLELVFGVAIN